MSSYTKGSSYEDLILNVCKTISKKNSFTVFDLSKRKNLSGAACVEHNIDIYWHFLYKGKQYKIIIECKNVDSGVKKEQVATLDSIAKDLGDVIPIIVTTKKFQSGAFTYAEKKEISAFVCNILDEEDWKGRIKTFSFDIESESFFFKKVNLCINADYVRTNKIEKSVLEKINSHNSYLCISGEEPISYHSVFKNNIYQYNKDSSKIEVLLDNAFVVYFFDETIRIKVDKIQFDDIQIRREHELFEYDASENILAKIIDVNEKTKYIIMNDGTIKPFD